MNKISPLGGYDAGNSKDVKTYSYYGLNLKASLFTKLDENKDGKISDNELDFFLKKLDEKFAKKYSEEDDTTIKEMQIIQKLKKHVLMLYGTKTENLDEFDKLFTQYLNEAKSENSDYEYCCFQVRKKFMELEYKKPISMEIIKASEVYNVNLPSDLVFEDMDWSGLRETFNYLSYNDKTFSKTSKENLPEGYDPQEVFDKGKSLGLGIDEVHEKGYTGKGVGVAICDCQLKPHQDLNIREYKCAAYALKTEDYFHASAVAGILAGKQTGVAPDSDVYFFAEHGDMNFENGGTDLIDSLKSILEKNKELPDDKKIRVVSISGPIYGGGDAEAVAKELTDSGVWVLSSDEFYKNFDCLEKKDPMGDSDNFENYQVCSYDKPNKNALYVNSGDRTVPDPSSETAYRHDSRVSTSWAIPVVAGYYALACQADTSMTPERFIELAHQTACVQPSTTIEYNDEGNYSYPIVHPENTVDIQIIDIKALLAAIEKEKYQK